MGCWLLFVDVSNSFLITNILSFFVLQLNRQIKSNRKRWTIPVGYMSPLSGFAPNLFFIRNYGYGFIWFFRFLILWFRKLSEIYCSNKHLTIINLMIITHSLTNTHIFRFYTILFNHFSISFYSFYYYMRVCVCMCWFIFTCTFN